MNKSITVISDHFPSPGRPIYVFVQQLVFALVDMGVDVNVVAPQSITHALLRGEKILPREFQAVTNLGNHFMVYRPYNISFGTGHKHLSRLFSIYNQKNLVRVLNKLKHEILYGHFWYNAHRVSDYALEHNIPLFVACGEGDNAIEDLCASLSDDEKLRLKESVKGVISVSSENKRKSVLYGLAEEDSITVLPNCVDEALFHCADGLAKRNELGLSCKDFVISFTGAFIHRKGSRTLSEAIKQINNSNIKAIFMGKPLVGDDCTPDCPGIVYMSSTEHEEIPGLLNASDLFVLPTLNEGCCNAIVEALACGIPVVSSNKPFNEDILNDGNSIVVNPESVEEVASAISQLMNDRDLYSQKKKYATEHSNEYSIVERAKKIYNFICERSTLR